MRAVSTAVVGGTMVSASMRVVQSVRLSTTGEEGEDGNRQRISIYATAIGPTTAESLIVMLSKASWNGEEESRTFVVDARREVQHVRKTARVRITGYLYRILVINDLFLMFYI